MPAADEPRRGRASGPSLADLKPLRLAEERIIADLAIGEFDRLGDGLPPETDDPSREVRAAFLRFLILGGDQQHRPHEKGVRVSGGWITGVLDLEGCRIPRDLGLRDCRFDAVPVLRSAVIDNLFLDGSRLPGIQAERLEARGGVSLYGATLDGEARFTGSQLGGTLGLDGAAVGNGRVSLAAEDLVARAVELRGARLRGALALAGARLAGDCDMTGASIEVTDGVAVDGDSLNLGGNLALRSTSVTGELRFTGVRVGGDLDLTGATLVYPAGEVLHLNRAVVRGGLFLRGGARIDGALDLTGASVDTLHDEEASWPAPGNLLLNRCLYNALIGGPVDAHRRLDWLSRQSPQRWGEDFWPQPYEHLAHVFSEMGHDEDARAVLVEKERLQRQARRDRATNPAWRALLALKDRVLGVTLAYGRQPLRAFAWLFVFWLLGVAVFAIAQSLSAIKPNSPVVLRSPEWTMCGVDQADERVLGASGPTRGRALPGQSQLHCFLAQPEASSYPAFNAWMYSLDTLFPVLEIGQKEYWRPDPAKRFGGFTMGYFYFQAIIGWALSLLAIAGFSGLVKSR